MKNNFNQLRQKPGTSIGDFKKEFDVQYEAICGAGVPATAAPELAILFLSKLDPHRYAAMLAQLTNDATLGRAFPQTLHAAVVLYCTYSTYVPYSLSPYRVLNSDTASALTSFSRHIVISLLSIVSYPLAC